METPIQDRDSATNADPQSTVIALFEDGVDAEHAIQALRKAEHEADRVSLLVRHRQEEQTPANGAADVARDVMAAALGAVAQWLTGLAELIVSERGRYLVAGPMGAALTGIGRIEPAAHEPGAGSAAVIARDLNPDSLNWVLTEFGFTAKEATYVEHRLTAGATLVGVTTADDDGRDRVRQVFSDHDAVFICDAMTSPELLATTGALLAAAPTISGSGDVGVADVVARIRTVESSDQPSGLDAAVGRLVLCHDGEEAGAVERLLVEALEPGAGTAANPVAAMVAPRYVVVGFGGVFRIGRRRVAVPAQLVDLDGDPVRLRVDKSMLSGAPPYDEDAPLGRREEERIYRYFELAPYWTTGEQSLPASDQTEGELHASDSERE